MKCSACLEKKCKRKYKNRNECVGKEEKIRCSCACQVSRTRNVVATASAVTFGAAVVGGGIALTIFSGGIAASAGIAMSSVGSTLIFQPLKKQMSGDRISLRETLKDVTVGAAGGALGLIGMSGIGNDLANLAVDVAKVGIKASAGMVESAYGATSEMMGDTVEKSSMMVHDVMEKSSMLVYGAVGATSTMFTSAAHGTRNFLKRKKEEFDDNFSQDKPSLWERTSKKFNRKRKSISVETDTLEAIKDGMIDPNKLYQDAIKQFVAEFLKNDDASLCDIRRLFRNDQNDEISKICILNPENSRNYKETFDILNDIQMFFDYKIDDQEIQQKRQTIWKSFSKSFLTKGGEHSIMNGAILQAIETGAIDPKKICIDVTNQLLLTTAVEISEDLEIQTLYDIRLLFKDDHIDEISKIYILPPEVKKQNNEEIGEIFDDFQTILRGEQTVEEVLTQKKKSIWKKMTIKFKKKVKQLNSIDETENEKIDIKKLYLEAKNQVCGSFNTKEDDENEILCDLRMLFKDVQDEEISQIYILPQENSLENKIVEVLNGLQILFENEVAISEFLAKTKKSFWRTFSKNSKKQEKYSVIKEVLYEVIESGAINPKQFFNDIKNQLLSTTEKSEDEILYDIRLLFKNDQNDYIAKLYILPEEKDFKNAMLEILNELQMVYKSDEIDEFANKVGNKGNLEANDVNTKTSKFFKNKKVADAENVNKEKSKYKGISVWKKMSFKLKTKEKHIAVKQFETIDNEEILHYIRVLYRRDLNDEISKIFILPIENLQNSQEKSDEILCDIHLLFKDEQAGNKVKTIFKLSKEKKVSINKTETKEKDKTEKSHSILKRMSFKIKTKEKPVVTKSSTETDKVVNIEKSISENFDEEEFLYDISMLYKENQIKEDNNDVSNENIMKSTTNHSSKDNDQDKTSLELNSDNNSQVSSKLIKSKSKKTLNYTDQKKIKEKGHSFWKKKEKHSLVKEFIKDVNDNIETAEKNLDLNDQLIVISTQDEVLQVEHVKEAESKTMDEEQIKIVVDKNKGDVQLITKEDQSNKVIEIEEHETESVPNTKFEEISSNHSCETKDKIIDDKNGAITGPIGASGGALAKGASGAAKVGLKIAAGSSAGAVSGAIGETVKLISGEEVSAESFAKSIAIGAISGAVGGASSQAASSISNTVSDEVTKAVTRVGVQATSAVATDASLQLIQTGTVDPTKLCLNATGQLIVASTAEVSASAAQRTESYANRKNEEFMKDNNVSPEDAKVFKEIIEEAKTADPDRLNKGKKVGPHKLHKMTREPERKGQIAGDYGPKGDNGRRGAGRVLVQEKRGNIYYVDHTPDHDYANMKKSLPSLLDDPLGNHLRADQINAFSVLNEDDEDEDYKKKN